MLFFKEKEDMGLEASLKLLDLPQDATIDDANQAYTYLHRMLDMFHQDTGDKDRGDRQEDMDLLTCAYEKAIVYLSDPDSHPMQSAEIPPRSSAVDASKSTDLHFTLNFSADANKDAFIDDGSPLPEPNVRTVEDAISIISRQLHQTESMLPGAQQAVELAKVAAEAANRQHESTKQANMAAVVAAKSAKTRSLLLEIEAKRAMEDAIAVAEKARDRVIAARQAAREARDEVDKAREQAGCAGKSEMTAAAEVVCSEDRLEKAKAQLKTLTHTLVETRHRMSMFQDTTAAKENKNPEAEVQPTAPMPDDQFSLPHAIEREEPARQRILSDLLEIEASLDAGKGEPIPTALDGAELLDDTGRALERRRHHRISYPFDQRPVLSIDGRKIPVLDLSSAGMRLERDDALACPHIVRGVIAFADQRPLTVTGKVVRQNDDGLGLRLVTRIGKHILDQERFRINA